VIIKSSKTAINFDKEDIERILLQGAAGENTGAFDHISWSVRLLGDTTASPVSRLISLHESLHSDLNSNTAYGMILSIYAYLAVNTAIPQFQKSLQCLVRRCLITHEVFATYLSVLIVSMTKGNDKPKSRELLKDYPMYLKFYDEGKRLCRGFSGGYLRYHSVTTCLRVCMQTTMLKHLLNIGLKDFNISESYDFPDRILDIIKRKVSPKFWEQTLLSAKEAAQDLPGWDVIMKSESDDTYYHKAFSHDYDDTSHFIMNYFHDSLKAMLQNEGIIVLSYDGHIDFVSQLMEQAYAIVPFEKAKKKILKAKETDTPEELSVFNFQYERLVLYPYQIKAFISELDDMPVKNWNELSAGAAPDEHFFIISRMCSDFTQHYEFSKKDMNFLASQNDPAVCLRRSGINNEGERIVELFILKSPEQLIRLSDFELPLISNISMVSLAADEWFTRWYDVLWTYSYPTVLFNLPPFRHFNSWSKQRAFNVKYGSINIDFGENKYTVFACQPQTKKLRSIFFAPCSSIVNSAFVYYLTELIENKEVFVREDDFIYESARNLNIAIGHLFREECYFDFNSGNKV